MEASRCTVSCLLVLLVLLALGWLGGRSAGAAERASFLASDGVRLSYLTAGPAEAPPMVFVPGWMCPAWIWERQIASFAASNRVLALDPRAQGESERVVDDLTPHRRARDIAELIAHERLANVTLVGWSLAVGEALGYVEQTGTSNLTALVLVDGFLGREPSKEGILGRQTWVAGLLTNRPAFMQGFTGMFFKQPPSPELLARLQQDLAKVSTAAAYTVLTTASLRDHRPILEKLDRPVLYAHQPRLKAEAAIVRERLPGAVIREFTNSAHALFLDEADEFNRVVDGFVREARQAASARRAAAAKPARPVLYDEKASGAELIAAALKEAKPGNQRVLLMFGANWCGWCHKLHRTFREDSAVAARLKTSYQLVLVDMNGTHNADVSRQYGRNEQEGVPYLIVLDAEGKVLARQETGALEVGDHHDPAKVLAFLDRWKP